MPFEKQLEELARRRARALEMGGPDKVQRPHDRGSLTARERIDRLLDPGSFLELGLLNTSIHQVDERTPIHDLDHLRDTYQEILQRLFL